VDVSPTLQGKWFKDVLYKAKEAVEEMFLPSEFSEIRVRRKCQLSSYKLQMKTNHRERKGSELNLSILHWTLQL
jgi:hypothetical protein